MKHGYWTQIVEARRILDKAHVPEKGREIYMTQDVMNSITDEIYLPSPSGPPSQILGMHLTIVSAVGIEGYLEMEWDGGKTYD